MATMTGRLDDLPAISVPKRLNYFPPIASAATMFKRRKNPSPRELYHLSPQNHDLILSNPPVTPWDDPPEFFRTFIGTPDDVKRETKSSTWPFLRQIGPKCAFKGMRKKQKEGGDGEVDMYNVPNPRNAFNRRFLEPECHGIAREYSSPRLNFFSSRYADLRKGIYPERQLSSAPFTEGGASLRHTSSSTRKVKAPPPSETRSAKSDDSPRDAGMMDQYHISPAFGNIKSFPQRPIRVNEPKLTFEAFKKKHRSFADGGRIVRFENSPLPEKLQNLNATNPESFENSKMDKLTWNDIVQAPVKGTIISVEGDTRVSEITPKPSDENEDVEESSYVQWRLPKSQRRIVASVDTGITRGEKRVGVKVSDRDISTWIDNVRRAQPPRVESM